MKRNIFLLSLSIVFGAYAAETTNSTEDLIPVDKIRFFFYGGPGGNEFFQKASRKAKQHLKELITSGSPFNQIVQETAQKRHDIAVQTNTPSAENFGFLRQNLSLQNTPGAITPVCTYPYMRRMMMANVSALAPCEDWQALDNNLEYRYRTYTTLGWIQRLAVENDINTNPISHLVIPILNGDSQRTQLHNIDSSGGLPIDTSMNPRYQNQFKESYAKALQGEDTPNLTLSYVEVRIKSTDLRTRGILFPRDAETKQDLSDVPFILIHPFTAIVPAHMQLCEMAFEKARQAKDAQEAIIAVGVLQYWGSLTMMASRGSASMIEWWTETLLEMKGVKPPVTTVFSQIDQIAQATLTMDDFLKQYLGFFDRKPQTIVRANKLLNNIKTILVVSPPVVTGGPENLSQVCAATRKMGFDSYMLWMFENFVNKEIDENGKTWLSYNNSNDLTPDRYKRLYGVTPLAKKVPLDEHTLVILPEVATDWETFFEPANRLVSWLSLGNFGGAANSIFKELIGKGLLSTADCTHTYQAPWIGKQLTAWGVSSLPLYDYISSVYWQNDSSLRQSNSIAYFPRKGGDLAAQFIMSHPQYTWIRLENLDEQGMRRALNQATLYLDFGHFPGRDRTPREASACGSIIMINSIGCASDYDSFPLTDTYKFKTDDISSGKLSQMVSNVMTNPHLHQQVQYPYRTNLLGEYAVFEGQLRELLGEPHYH